jgi:TPR repeat protein
LKYLYLFLVLLSVYGLSNIYDYRTSRKAADQGDAEAQMALSKMYYVGCGVRKNINESLKWIRKASDQGHADAQCRLGLAYANGKGNLDKDYDEAIKWIRKAADQGHVEAQFSLGLAYANSMGNLDEDYDEAVKWFRKAADQGEIYTKDLLASIYNLGLAGDNDKEAVKWMSEVIEETNRETKSNYW